MVIKSVEWLRGVHITWMLALDSKKPRPQCNFLKKSLWLFIAKSLRLQALKKRIINYFHLRVTFHHLTLSCKMLKNDQTYFKNLAVFPPQDF